MVWSQLVVERGDHMLAAADRRARRLALLFLDVDGWGEREDRDGHACGERILVDVADAVRQQGDEHDAGGNDPPTAGPRRSRPRGAARRASAGSASS